MNTAPVPKRRFGRTELRISVLSCGGMRFQQSWNENDAAAGIEPDSQRNLEAIVRRALDLGINHFETARGYGTSEMQLGKILPDVPRDAYILQTKVAPSENAAQFAEKFERSFSLLAVDRVDLLSLHGINTDELLDFSLRRGGCMDVCRRFQREGRVRFVGFSTHGATDLIERAARTAEFDYVNLHWYWVNQRNARAIDAAAENDMGVFIISPSDKGGMLYRPSATLARLCEPLSPIAFNDLFCLLRPDVHTLSLGAALPSDFDEHASAVNRLADPGTPGLIREIESRLVAEMKRAMGSDWIDRWSEGVPEWQDVPGEINVIEILRLRNLADGLGMLEFAKERYNVMPDGGHWVPGNVAADFDDGEMRAALKASPFADTIPSILRDAHRRFFNAPKPRLSES